MTNEQKELLTVIMNNKEVLEELLRGIKTQKQVKNLKIKESILLVGGVNLQRIVKEMLTCWQMKISVT